MKDTSKIEMDTDDHNKAASIHVRNLSKSFDGEQDVETVFENLSFDIEPNSFVTIIGRSGSGKSTLLNIIGGLLDPTEGEVRIDGSGDGEEATIGYVFQSPRLLPWNTCINNIELVHESNENYTEDLAKKYLDQVGLEGQYDKYPTQLSGGQQQRVGIARALSIDPDLLLMDEPFSNLDEITADSLRNELTRLFTELNKTILFVTHDITEAVELSDRILMLGDSEIYADMEIPLSRPREKDSTEFLKLQQQAVSTFKSINDK